MSMPGYTKLFNSILASTIWREDDKIRIVWITLLAMADKNGLAEGSIPGLADFARVSIEDVERALKSLQSPDKYSRTKTNEGRRIKAVDGGWEILNHPKYRAKMNADERRAYNREKQREWRAGQKMSNSVIDGQSQIQMSPLSAHTEAEAEAEAIKKNTANKPVRPSLEEVKLAAAKSGLPEVQAESFFNYYESNGWKVGKNQMKSWLAALAGWRTRWEANRSISSGVKQSVPIYTQKTTLEEKIKSLLVDSYIDDQWVKRPKPGHEDEVRSLRAKLREIEAKIISA